MSSAALPPEQIVFGTDDVARITGATIRQLQWWSERRIVDAGMIGNRRAWSLQEIVRIATILELQRKGMGLASCKLALQLCDSVAGRYLAVGMFHKTIKPRRAVASDSIDDLARVIKEWECPLILIDRHALSQKISAKLCHA